MLISFIASIFYTQSSQTAGFINCALLLVPWVQQGCNKIDTDTTYIFHILVITIQEGLPSLTTLVLVLKIQAETLGAEW